MGKSFYIILYTFLAIALIPFALTLKKAETVRQAANAKIEQRCNPCDPDIQNLVGKK